MVSTCQNSSKRSWTRNYVERTEAGSDIVYKSIGRAERPAVAPSPMKAATRNLTIDVDSNMCNHALAIIRVLSVPDYTDTWICDAATRNLGQSRTD